MPNAMRRSIFGRLVGIDDNGSFVGEARASEFTFAAAAGAANVCNVTIQAINYEGTSIAGVKNLDLWLSDSASGIGLTATTASGTVTCTTGTDLFDFTAKKLKRVQTDATGKIVLAITDTAKTAFKVCYQPNSEVAGAKVGITLQTADYG